MKYGFSLEQDNSPVAAVCGSVGYIYGPLDKKTGFRELNNIIQFRHYGAALLWATEFDDSNKRVAPPPLRRK